MTFTRLSTFGTQSNGIAYNIKDSKTEWCTPISQLLFINYHKLKRGINLPIGCASVDPPMPSHVVVGDRAAAASTSGTSAHVTSSSSPASIAIHLTSSFLSISGVGQCLVMVRQCSTAASSSTRRWCNTIGIKAWGIWYRFVILRVRVVRELTYTYFGRKINGPFIFKTGPVQPAAHSPFFFPRVVTRSREKSFDCRTSCHGMAAKVTWVQEGPRECTLLHQQRPRVAAPALLGARSTTVPYGDLLNWTVSWKQIAPSHGKVYRSPNF